MRVIESVIKVILCVVFIVSLLGLTFSLSAYQMTDVNNVKRFMTEGALRSVPTNVLEKDLSESITDAKDSCEKKNPTQVSLGNFRLSCKELESIDRGATVEEILNLYIEKEYYSARECEFMDCVNSAESLADKVFVLVGTQKAHDFYKNLIVIFGMISTLLVSAYVILVRKASLSMMGLGISAVIAGIPAIILMNLKRAFIEALKGSVAIYESTAGIFKSNFWYVFLMGTGLVFLGLVTMYVEKEQCRRREKANRNKEKEDEDAWMYTSNSEYKRRIH